MASISNSKARYYQYLSQNDQEANHLLESDGDLLIKTLSEKQLNTYTSLEKELKREKEFETSHSYQPITELTSGTMTHENFRKLCSSNEIDRNPCTSNDDKAFENVNIGRHVQELALSVKPNSLETKLLKFAISCNAVGRVKQDARPTDHPINRLEEIEHDRFSHLRDECNPLKTAKTILRKRKQLLEAISEPVEIKQKPVPSNSKTLWDVTETNGRKLNRRNRKVYSCSKSRMFTIRNGEITEIREDINSRNQTSDAVLGEDNKSTEKCTSFKKLTENEIKSIPRFNNYTKGEPSKIIYLKNLANSIEEKDLSFLIQKYNKSNGPQITFKLMTNGRMRGQAFIYLYDIKTAIDILEEVNGLIIKGKPIIAQFSSKQDNT